MVYAYYDEAALNAAGLSPNCRPFATTQVIIWPNPATNTINVAYDGCNALLTPSCSGMTVTPSIVNIVEANSTTVNAVLGGGAGSFCNDDAQNVTIINPSFDATFDLDDSVCETYFDDVGVINLSLNTTPSFSAAELTALGLANIGDVVEWSGNGVTDNGNGTASFDAPTLSGSVIPGAYVVCAEVGLTGCKDEYCRTINVFDSPNAIITDEEVCIYEFPAYIDLSIMNGNFTLDPTDVPGLFDIIGGSGTGFIEGNSILVISDPANLPTFSSSTGVYSGNFDLSYYINTCLLYTSDAADE